MKRNNWIFFIFLTLALTENKSFGAVGCNVPNLEKGFKELLDADSATSTSGANAAAQTADRALPAEVVAKVNAEIDAELAKKYSEPALEKMYGNNYAPPEPPPGALPSLKYGPWDDEMRKKRSRMMGDSQRLRDRDRELLTAQKMKTAKAKYEEDNPPPSIAVAPPNPPNPPASPVTIRTPAAEVKTPPLSIEERRIQQARDAMRMEIKKFDHGFVGKDGQPVPSFTEMRNRLANGPTLENGLKAPEARMVQAKVPGVKHDSELRGPDGKIKEDDGWVKDTYRTNPSLKVDAFRRRADNIDLMIKRMEHDIESMKAGEFVGTDRWAIGSTAHTREMKESLKKLEPEIRGCENLTHEPELQTRARNWRRVYNLIMTLDTQ